MYNRILILLFVSIFSSLFTQGQTIIFPPDTVRSSNSFPSSSIEGSAIKHGFIPKKPDFGLQMGSTFTTSSGYGSGFTTFVSPRVTYPFTSRFRINAGVTYINTTLYGVRSYFPVSGEQTFNGNFSSILIYGSGEYLFNDRLSISGTVYKSFPLYNDLNKSYPYGNYNPEGAFMKVDYRIFDNVHIEAGFGYSKGINPYYNNPFSNSYSPFPDPFHP